MTGVSYTNYYPREPPPREPPTGVVSDMARFCNISNEVGRVKVLGVVFS